MRWDGVHLVNPVSGRVISLAVEVRHLDVFALWTMQGTRGTCRRTIAEGCLAPPVSRLAEIPGMSTAAPTLARLWGEQVLRGEARTALSHRRARVRVCLGSRRTRLVLRPASGLSSSRSLPRAALFPASVLTVSGEERRGTGFSAWRGAWADSKLSIPSSRLSGRS